MDFSENIISIFFHLYFFKLQFVLLQYQIQLNLSISFFKNRKKELRSRDSPPAAGRFGNIIPIAAGIGSLSECNELSEQALFRVAILRGAVFI